ncbi:hypothetical protein EMPS_09062 [Entomortierella parvispora]|uniref:G-protein coupled receptors family 2 profile 2 domain-containing protein n=1 Tax=Entomortierella parvispora TaxID=205924 RepID=A0A9P3LZY7_9FUNG|nr:hypothetical protein EMPS_09062 [Entomortierella parvispora]
MHGLDFLTRPTMGLALLAATLVLSSVERVSAMGSMVPYNGTVCNGFIDYQVWLPANTTTNDVDQALIKQGIENIAGLPAPCGPTYMAYACSVAYPRPVATGQTNSYNVLFACESTCQAVQQSCAADFAFMNMTDLLPNCATTIPNTEELPGGSIPYQPDGSCNVVPFQSSNSTCSSPLPGCISPFVEDLVFKQTNGLQNTDDINCGCGCCLPCPQTDAFYKPGILNKGFFITDVLKGISSGLALILALSYVVLPDKLQHPSNLILFAAIATAVFDAAVAPSYGNPRRIQCAANGITTATSYNNTLCTIQGAWLLFGAIATTAWLSIVIVNLHLHTVWNSNWLSRRSWLSHVIGWIIPAAFAAIAVITKSIGWNNSNMCMATQDTSNALLFIPLGVVMIPSTLLHIATFAHIIRITLQAENSETVSHSTLSSGRAARISHRRHVMNAIRIQWRAALLAVVVSSSVLIYWAFYLVQGAKTDMTWMSTWQLCIFTQRGNQEQCGQCATSTAEKVDTSFQNNLHWTRKRPLISLFLKNIDVQSSILKRIYKECPRLRKYLVVYLDNTHPYDRGFYVDLVTACPLLYGFHVPNITLSLDEIEDLLSLFRQKLTVLSLPEMYVHPEVYTILERQTPKLEELLVLDKPSNGLVPSLRTLQMFLTSAGARHLRHLRLQATAFYGDNFDINSLHKVDRVGYWFPSAGYSEGALGNVEENPESEWILAGNAPRITPAVHVKEPWTCRFLETLHLRIVGRKLYFRLEDNSRVLFGYLSRVCPLLRDLSIERKRQSLSLKGGFCLLSRLHHLEKIEMKAQYGDLSDLDWICRYPTALQKMGWLVKARRLRKSRHGLKGQDEDPNAGLHSTGYQAPGAIAPDQILTKDDLRDVGYLDDVIELLKERAQPGFGNGQGCWPRLREMYLPRQIPSTPWSRTRDQPDVMIHRYRPEVKTGTFEKVVGPGVVAMVTG